MGTQGYQPRHRSTAGGTEPRPSGRTRPETTTVTLAHLLGRASGATAVAVAEPAGTAEEPGAEVDAEGAQPTGGPSGEPVRGRLAGVARWLHERVATRPAARLAAVLLLVLAALAALQTPTEAATVLPKFPRATTICVENTAHGRWPVATAVQQWNRSRDLRLIYRRGAGSCKSYSQVIQVRSGYYGRNGWIGYGQFPRQLAWGRVVATTRLNSTYGTRASKSNLTYTVLHEMGHNLGLGHNTGKHSVMSYSNLYRTAPTVYDYRRIHRLYR